MYFWNSYPFIRLSIILITGIIFFEKIPFLWNSSVLKLGIGISILFISISISKGSSFYKLRHLNGLIVLVLIFFIGGCFTQLKYHTFPEYHYKNRDIKMIGFMGTIASPVHENTNYFRYTFDLEHIIVNTDSIVKSVGKINFFVKKDTDQNYLKYGDRVITYGKIYPLRNPGNPNTFNYKEYLKTQNIYGHSFVKSQDIKVLSNKPPNFLFNWAYQLRQAGTKIIDKNIPQSRESGIIKALLLGIKDHLDNDIKASYSSAGILHILAVSGLHVGIIYLLIHLLLGKLKIFGKKGRYLFAFLSIFFISFYAILTGLSPSVLRAATMFSFIIISEASARKGNIYNTLGFSAFVLLLFDPYLIYAAGFQLSYAAVFGIVYFQPKIYQLFSFSNLILDKAWAIICVSIAAQIATFPLSIYYFHQFPIYFLIANLIVIPISSVLLISGISMLIVHPIFNVLGAFFGKILYYLIWLINELIEYISLLPHSVIDWIYIDKSSLLFIYAILILLLIGLHFKSFKTLVICALFVLLFLHSILLLHTNQAQKKELVFYDIADEIAIDYIHGHTAQLYVENYDSVRIDKLSYAINPFRLASLLAPIATSIHPLKKEKRKNIYALQFGEIAGKKIVFFDSTTFHLDFKGIIYADFIIINNKSIKNMKWLNKNFKFNHLIVSNKNDNFYSKKIEKEAKKLNINFHSLKTDGFLSIELN